MNIKEILKQKGPSFSFEFFPPKSPKTSQELYQNIKEFISLGPSYISVTYGAGGSTRELTHDLVVKLHQETGITIIPHLTCIGHSKDDIKSILDRYVEVGIENIMALRGDPPKGELNFRPHPEGFRYACDLVDYIHQNYPHLGIGIAGFPEGHPETPNRLHELRYLKQKVSAGADYICTQLFFDNKDFYDFRDRCQLEGIHIPIIAGIMPITSIHNMERMAELALGARYPAPLLRSLRRAHNDDYAQRVGIHWSTEQVRDLLDQHTAGVHFYTLNKSLATRTIYHNLGVINTQQLQKVSHY